MMRWSVLIKVTISIKTVSALIALNWKTEFVFLRNKSRNSTRNQIEVKNHSKEINLQIRLCLKAVNFLLRKLKVNCLLILLSMLLTWKLRKRCWGNCRRGLKSCVKNRRKRDKSWRNWSTVNKTTFLDKIQWRNREERKLDVELPKKVHVE